MRLAINPVVRAALDAGAALVISISGGKDGQAMLSAIMREYASAPWPVRPIAVHADLGRVEWPQTAGVVEGQARAHGVSLEVVQRPQGDLLQQWEDRAKALEGSGKPFWSSSTNRYCTSDQKRGQIDKVLRRFPLVISAEGIRAAESDKRAGKTPLTLRHLTGKALEGLSPEAALRAWLRWDRVTKGGKSILAPLLALTWYPIFNYSLADVWAELGTVVADLDRRRALYQVGHVAAALLDWPAHPAYVFGNDRLSCALCILGSESDLANGAAHNPGIHQAMQALETQYDCRFRDKLSLVQIGELADRRRAELAGVTP